MPFTQSCWAPDIIFSKGMMLWWSVLCQVEEELLLECAGGFVPFWNKKQRGVFDRRTKPLCCGLWRGRSTTSRLPLSDGCDESFTSALNEHLHFYTPSPVQPKGLLWTLWAPHRNHAPHRVWQLWAARMSYEELGSVTSVSQSRRWGVDLQL